jgi:LemA protein
MLIVAIVIVAVVVILLGVFLFLFNRLVRLRNKVDNAWHQIDVELNRRHDLVPELAEVVRGYAAHEKSTFESVAQARARAMSAGSVGEKGPTEDGLSGAIGGLFAVAESYPDLKANKDFLDFQAQLSSTETRIAGSRKYYNGAVMYYMNARQAFPGNVVAKMFKTLFGPRDYFEIKDPEVRQVPSV